MVDISLEFFPPKSEPGRRSLDQCAGALTGFGPTFVSVTYGAAGSGRDRTLATVASLSANLTTPVAAHITTIGASAEELHLTIDAFSAVGVRHLVALRGDQKPDDDRPRAYESAAELVEAIRARPDGDTFNISVAAYPEVHPRASSPDADIRSLRQKLQAGANQAITQFFFDPDVYFRFVERAHAAGIDHPLVPGVMPITSFKGIRRFAAQCGTTIPTWLHSRLSDLDDDPEIQRPVAATVLTDQCRRLIDGGVDQIHFYTMNRRQLTAAACHILGLGRTPAAAAQTPASPNTLATTGSTI